MTQTVLYKYMGTNGTILSPIHLEDIYYVRYLQLTATSGKTLTKDRKKFSTVVTVPEEEAEQWIEV